MKLFQSFYPAQRLIALIVVLTMLVPSSVFATSTTPDLFVYQGRLLDSAGAPVTAAHVFRFSFWKSADWVSGDATGGAINTSATNYGGWSEVQTVTPNSSGIFSVQLGSSTALPTIDFVLHKYIQVEVKTVAGADTTYQKIDPTGDAGSDTNDRMILGSLPYAKNAETVANTSIGTSSGNLLILGANGKISVAQMAAGTNAQTFTLNAANAVGDAVLTFGSSVLTQSLTLSAINNRFEFSKDLYVIGALGVTGVMSGQSLNVGTNAVIGGTTTLNGAMTNNSTTTLNGLTTVNANVKVRGSLSGRTLTADQLRNCDSIDTDANGNLICGTDNGGTQFSNTGSLQAGFDARFVKKSGDTMTGNLILRNNAALNASGSLLTNSNITLNSDNGAADAVLTFGNSTLAQTLKFSHANQRFEFTKDLYITGAIGVTGTMSGRTLNVSGSGAKFNGQQYYMPRSIAGGSGSVLKAQANGNLYWGTVSAGSNFGSGNVLSIVSRGIQFYSGTTLSNQAGFNEALNLPHSGLATQSITRLSVEGNLINIGTIQAGETHLRRGGIFLPKADNTTAAGAYSVAIGDLNGDGKADLVTANASSNTASVFLNNGNGTFATKVDYATGTSPLVIAIGDLNGDGKADLAVANSGSASTSVLLNNGNGTFATKVDYTTGTSPYSVAIGDLNGDGKADLAVANINSASTSVFLNNGNGTFAPKVDYTTGTSPASVVIGDVNGDGKADLATANTSSNTTSVFLNIGNGTFAAKADYATGTAPRFLSIGDLNSDGKPDLAVANQNSNTTSVFLNNGNGTFATKVDYATGTSPRAVSIGDLNGDGKADIAVTNYSSDTASVFINNGNGTFAAKVDYATGFTPASVAIGDLNGDGTADLATANYDSNTASVFLNTSKTIFFASAATGAVGIGTANPTATLTVSGSFSLLGSAGISRGGGLNASGSLLTNSNITLNSDNGAADAVLTFGNSTLAQTLKFSHANQRFEFTKDLYITGAIGVTGTMSGQSLNVSGAATIGGAATFNGAMTNNSTTLLNGLTTVNANVKVRGSLSGRTLTADQLRNCDTIDTDANGNLVCGTDASGGGASGTGTAIEDADRNTKVTTTPNDTIKMTVAGKDRLTISGDYVTLSGNTIPVAASAFTSLTRTFATPDSTGNVGSYSSMKIGADNLPVVAYYDATNQDLKVTKCGNATCTSGNTTTTVDSTGSVGSYASLAIGTDGFPVIAYSDGTNSDLKVAKCTNADCSTSTITSVDTAGSVGSSTSIAIGTDSFPVISYLDSTNENLKVAKCGNAACSSGNTITTVESTNDVGYYSQIAIGADGFPIIAHLQFTASDLRVLKCGNAACTSGNSATAVDTGSISNNGFGIAIGTDSYPVITYNESNTLKLAKCSTADCSSSSIATVDATSGISQFKSMTIGTDGFPIISYGRTSAGDFYIAKCGNAACSSGNTLTSVDATNDVGNHSSIVIAASGYPIASYYDNTDGDLQIVSCVDATCSATTGGSYTAGSGHDAGSPGNYFKNIYTSAIKLKTPSGFLTFTGVGNPSLDVAAVHDADNDTKIQTEESTDEDILRFDTAGKERLTIDATGVSTFSGSVATKMNLSINSDADSTNAVLTFGNATASQTLAFSHANQRFEFSKGIYVRGISTLSGATTISNTAGENNLILSGRGGTDEGGQIVFMPAVSRPYSFMWDNYQNTFRLLRGDTNGISVTTLMTMTASGSLGIGTSPGYKLDVTDSRSSDYIARFVNTANAAGAQGIIVQAGSNSLNNSYIVRFLRPDSTEIGKIVQDSAASVAYMTTSDKRTKNDLGMDVPGLDALMKIQVHRYTFKNDITGEEHIGFFAQDLAEVFPEAVYKGDSGQQVREPWSVDYSRLTPLLVKSVQEMQQEILRQNNQIEELKSRLDIIEAILK